MSALFRPRSNTIFRLVLFLLVAGGAGTISGFMVYARTPYGQRRGVQVLQPIQFDHRHHVVDDGIDCRYCHNTVDRGPSAGVPSTELCLGCHSQIWNKSPLLDQVRESWFTGRPIRWVRVHILPQFVYFDHSIHVAKGIGCESCHGRVDQMAAVQQVAPLTMGWCLECHRNPVPNLRPQSAITAMGWQPKGEPAALGRELRQKYEIHTRTSCTTCHR